MIWKKDEFFTYVLVDLWGESDFDRNLHACRDPARRDVDDIKEIFYFFV
jgi:hypothetical protein